MNKYILSILSLLLLMTGVSIAYTNSPLILPGYNQYGYDTNLRGWSIWNGSINGTNVDICDSATQKNIWNGSWWICATDLKINKTGDNMTGRLLILENGSAPLRDTSSDMLVVSRNPFSIPNNPTGILMSSVNGTETYFTGARIRGTIAVMDNLQDGDTIFNFGATGSRANGLSNTVTMTIKADGAWNNTSSPSTVSFFTTPNGSTGRREIVNFNQTGNLLVVLPGKGFQLTSPDGTQTACITLSNAGVLTTTSGVCI